MSRDLTRIAHQMELERLYNKNQLIPRLRREFEEASDGHFIKYLAEKNIPRDFGIDLLVQMSLHKRADLPTLVGVLKHHFPNDTQQCADMIYNACVADLVDWNPTLSRFIVRFTVSDDVQEELDRYQFPLPMVIQPKEVTNNRETGLLLSGGSIILKQNHHENDVCLDHINRMNSIKLSIDTNTATMITNKWRNMDKPKPGETHQDFQKRLRAFEKYDRVSREVIKTVCLYGNEFYLTHKYDKRGRTYCQGYHINYQGTAWSKAIVQLADKELVE